MDSNEISVQEFQNIDNKEYVLVFKDMENAVITLLDYSGFCIDRDVEEGLGADDIGLYVKDYGLWLGEGVPKWNPGPWEAPDEGEISYETLKSRRLDTVELIKVGTGVPLFEERKKCYCCGRYLIPNYEIWETIQDLDDGKIKVPYCSFCKEKKGS